MTLMIPINSHAGLFRLSWGHQYNGQTLFSHSHQCGIWHSNHAIINFLLLSLLLFLFFLPNFLLVLLGSIGPGPGPTLALALAPEVRTADTELKYQRISLNNKSEHKPGWLLLTHKHLRRVCMYVCNMFSLKPRCVCVCVCTHSMIKCWPCRFSVTLLIFGMKRCCGL